MLSRTLQSNAILGQLRPSLPLCVSWILLNATGLGLGYDLGMRLVNAAQLPYVVDLIVLGIADALGLGIAQWVVVRRLFVHSWLWILLTLLGFATGPLLAFFLTTGAGPELLGGRFPGYYLAEAFQGLMLGSMQWMLLRGKTRRAGIWLLASSAGNVTGQTIFWRILAAWGGKTYGILNGVGGQFLSFSVGACIGGVSAVITYAGLAFLFGGQEPAPNGGGV